jgi:hypothetical protein
MAREKIVLHPPGGCDARGSGRGQQQHDSESVAFLIEERPQVRDSGEIAQNWCRGCLGRLGDYLWSRPSQPQDRSERQPLGNDGSSPAAPHFVGGFLGTALKVLFVGQMAFTAVMHRLPANVLPLPGGD